MAYSADGIHIATARESGSTVTVLDRLSGTSRQFTNTDMQIRDIKIADNTIFVVDTRKLVSWDLEADGMTHGVQGPRRVTFDETLAIDDHTRHLALSHDGSWIAFVGERKRFLYNIGARKIIYEDNKGGAICGIRFSLDGRQLWFKEGSEDYYLLGLEMAGDQSSTKVTERSWWGESLWFESRSPHGYLVGLSGRWVMDSRFNRILWLPPNWETPPEEGVWNGNFLALVDSRHPKPVVIEFQP